MSDLANNFVVVLNLTSDTVVTSISLGSAMSGALAVNSAGTTLYAATNIGVATIDLSTNTVTSSFNTGEDFFGLALNSGGSTAYSVSTTKVDVISLAGPTVTEQASLSSPLVWDTPVVAVNSSGTKIYVANQTAGTVSVYAP